MAQNETGIEETGTSRTVIIRLSQATHRLMRIRVAEEDTSIQKWLEALIERELGVATPPAAGDKPVSASEKGQKKK